MKIGFGAALWMRDHYLPGMHRMLDDLAMNACDGLELHYPYIFDAYRHKPQYLKELLDLHGLELASVFMRFDYASPELVAADAARNRQMMDFMAEMGGEDVLLDENYSLNGSFYAKRPKPKDKLSRFHMIDDTSNMMAEYAKDKGLKLSWHVHWGTLFAEEEWFHRFMEATDPDLIYFCPDTAQLKLCGYDEVGIVKQYAQRIRYAHFKDVVIRKDVGKELWPGSGVMPRDDGGYNVDSLGRMTELGRGEVNFHGIMDALCKAGFNGWIIDDFDYTGYLANEACRACIEYLNNALGVYGERQNKLKENS